jgi:hypothetical protein
MTLKIGEREYEFDCRLRTCVKIKSKFGKNYSELINDIEKLDVNDMLNLLYCGLDKNVVNENEFKDYVLDTCGMGDLYDYVGWFVKQLQYPGLSEEEIEKKLLEKKAKQARLQA